MRILSRLTRITAASTSPFAFTRLQIQALTMSSSSAQAEGSNYVPPKVWKWESKADNKFAAINQPTAGARFEKELPVGKHPFQLYSLATPNGQKVTILLEELLHEGVEGAEYDAWHVDIMNQDQFGSGFVAVNPNSKIPALTDHSDKGKPVRLFESGSILFHLAEKFAGQHSFLPNEKKAEVMNWLFWQMVRTGNSKRRTSIFSLDKKKLTASTCRFPPFPPISPIGLFCYPLGCRSVHRGRIWSFLRLCCYQAGIPHQSIYHGSQETAKCT